MREQSSTYAWIACKNLSVNCSASPGRRYNLQISSKELTGWFADVRRPDASTELYGLNLVPLGGLGTDKKILDTDKRIIYLGGINLARHRYRNLQFEGQNEKGRAYVRRICQHGLCCYAALCANCDHRLAAGLYGSSLGGVGA